MSKVIKIEGDLILVGTDDGGIEEVRRIDMNFDPAIGDEVEIFKTETKTMVSKKERPVAESNSGININVQNTNNAAQPVAYVHGKAVNKVVYCLLALFLGGLGIHKFYAGKTGAGIAYLLFCWTFIPEFIAFVEFIIALTKRSDANGMIVI